MKLTVLVVATALIADCGFLIANSRAESNPQSAINNSQSAEVVQPDLPPNPVQGKEELKNLDPFKTAGGALKPVVKEFKGVSVENGQLAIGFTPNVENPQICGMEILAE